MIKRDLYLDKIKKFIDEEEIKIITGVRRSGKTCLLKQIIEELKLKGVSQENIFYIPFESAYYDEINDYKDLNEFIFNKTKNIKGKVYLLFDEIQLVNNWEKSVNAYRIDLNCDIYITGSNSKLFSGELSTLISGRYIKIEVYPFSFKEILQYFTQKNIEINEKEVFNKYLKYGGLPRVLKFDDEEKLDYLEDIYSTIILKDIVSRNNIRNIHLLERLIKFFISNIGQTNSMESIRKYLKHEDIKVSTNTLSNYLKFINDAYVLLKAPKEEIKTKKLLTINEKYYCIDNGFYELQTGIEKSRGQILENTVFLELKRRGYKVTVGNVNGLEIDFVARKPNKTIYIQVSETIKDENTRKREFRPFNYIRDNYPKYILTLDDDWDYSSNGIIHLDILSFLKDDNVIF